MENPEEMDKFLETYYLPRLNQEEVDSLNRPITSSEIELVIKKTPSKQKSRTGGFHGEILPNIKRKAIFGTKMVEEKDVLSLPLARTPESQLAAGQSSTGRHWNSQKKIPHIQRQRRSHNETLGEAQSE